MEDGGDGHLGGQQHDGHAVQHRRVGREQRQVPHRGQGADQQRGLQGAGSVEQSWQGEAAPPGLLPDPVGQGEDQKQGEGPGEPDASR